MNGVFAASMKCVDYFYAHDPYHKWKNFHLLAVDGSRLHLPNHSTVKKEFGQILAGKNADDPCSMATCYMLYDPLNQVTLSAFDQIVSKTREIIRPNRKNPRKHRLKIPYSMNNRPLWIKDN